MQNHSALEYCRGWKRKLKLKYNTRAQPSEWLTWRALQQLGLGGGRAAGFPHTKDTGASGAGTWQLSGSVYSRWHTFLQPSSTPFQDPPPQAVYVLQVTCTRTGTAAASRSATVRGKPWRVQTAGHPTGMNTAWITHWWQGRPSPT